MNNKVKKGDFKDESDWNMWTQIISGEQYEEALKWIRKLESL